MKVTLDLRLSCGTTAVIVDGPGWTWEGVRYVDASYTGEGCPAVDDAVEIDHLLNLLGHDVQCGENLASRLGPTRELEPEEVSYIRNAHSCVGGEEE